MPGTVAPSPKRAATGNKMDSGSNIRPRIYQSKSQHLAQLINADSAESCNYRIDIRSDGSKRFLIPRSKLPNHDNNLHDHQPKTPAKKNTMSVSNRDSEDDLDIIGGPSVQESGLLVSCSRI